jgi:hypothetical protein
MKLRLIAALLLLSLAAHFEPGAARDAGLAAHLPAAPIAVTGADPYLSARSNAAAMPSLSDFIFSMRNGDPHALVGVYVRQVMALPVVQQPPSQPGYVSNEQDVITQFTLANQFGATGLLAHNYLAGDYFFRINKGQDVVLVYGDGRLKTYRIEEIQSYQALSPNSMFSNFVDLSGPGRTLTSTEVFNRVYGQRGALVLQTCIQMGSEASWGRIFLIGKESATRPVVRSFPHRLMSIGAMVQSFAAAN